MMRRKLLSFFTMLALASLLLATACTGGTATKEQSTPTPLPTSVTSSKPTFTVTKGDITAQVQFTARVVPSIQEELFFRSDGRVRKVYVRGGDSVTEGQVLADLVSLDQMESEARQQELSLRRAQIAYEMAWLNQQLASTRTPDWSEGYDIEMKMQQYEVELAQISLEETKLQNENLDTAINDARITSTINGKVLSLSVIEGAEVRAFQGLITVGDDSTLEVGATLTSTQMQELAEGMKATIELPSRPGEKLTGAVRSLPYPYGTGGGKNASGDSSVTSGTSTIDTATRVSLDDPSVIRGFRLGELVTVTVVKESKQNVLWLPPTAIRSFEGRNFVVVKTEALPKRVDVKLGIKNEERVEILSGVEEGQVIIAP